jgi:hypothetical protein
LRHAREQNKRSDAVQQNDVGERLRCRSTNSGSITSTSSRKSGGGTLMEHPDDGCTCRINLTLPRGSSNHLPGMKITLPTGVRQSLTQPTLPPASMKKRSMREGPGSLARLNLRCH